MWLWLQSLQPPGPHPALQASLSRSAGEGIRVRAARGQKRAAKNPGQYWDKPAVAPAVVFIAKGAPQVHEHSCAGGILGVTAMCVRLTDACDFTAD